MIRTFVSYSDPGHGWLKVPEATLKDLGLKAKDFSAYSYVDEGHMFLEEDCDVGVFWRAFEKKHGFEPKTRAKHCNGQSRVRSKWPNTAVAARYFVPSIAEGPTP